VDDGAVQAFGVILEDQLPVGRDVVVDPARGPQGGEVEAAEPPGDRREGLCERLGGPREVDENEALPGLERYGMERVIALVEPLDLAHVGRADQLPVDGVGPGVIGALDRFREPTARLLAQPGAAVAAYVVERP